MKRITSTAFKTSWTGTILSHERIVAEEIDCYNAKNCLTYGEEIVELEGGHLNI